MKIAFPLGIILLLCHAAHTQDAKRADVHWVASWATAQQAPDPQNNQLALDNAQLADASVRQIVHLSMGGSVFRLQLSNTFGTNPLVVDAVHLARAKSPASSAIDPSTDRAVTFAGTLSVTIPARSVYLSDPVKLTMPAGSDLAISLHYPNPPSVQTQHPGSRATSYIVHGQRCGDAEFADAGKTVRWLGISEVDVAGPSSTGAVIAFGDSITDGHGATTDGNDRWPDVLAKRLQADPRLNVLAVVNEGIGGNHLLIDGLGQAALARFDRDVLAISGGRTLIVLEGINDLGGVGRMKDLTQKQWDAVVERIEAAYGQIVERAHAHGLFVIGSTIMPDGGSDYYHPGRADEAARQSVNAWIRQRGHFDAVIDWDSVMRDPQNPERLRAAFDSGDHLHPGPAGYKAMADAVALGILKR